MFLEFGGVWERVGDDVWIGKGVGTGDLFCVSGVGWEIIESL